MCRRIAAAWCRIREPRFIRLVYLAFYASVAVLGGVSAFIRPPSSIEGEIGVTMTATWACFLLVGGTIGILAVLPGWWWAERIALVALGTGLVVYASTVMWLHVTSAGNRLPQMSMIVGSGLLLVLRAHLTRGLDYEPRR